jgi:hypothetical protein
MAFKVNDKTLKLTLTVPRLTESLGGFMANFLLHSN